MPEAVFFDDALRGDRGRRRAGDRDRMDAFRALDLDRVKALLKTPVIVDLRNIYRPEDARKRGFTYISVGRGLKPGGTPSPAATFMICFGFRRRRIAEIFR